MRHGNVDFAHEIGNESIVSFLESVEAQSMVQVLFPRLMLGIRFTGATLLVGLHCADISLVIRERSCSSTLLDTDRDTG